MNVMIIDEISMVSNRLFYTIDVILRTIRPNGLPFGGVQLICSGDFAQLPQIIKKEMGRKRKRFAVVDVDTRPLFCTEMWTRANVRIMTLSVDHRQSGDANYASLLKRARIGKLTDADVAMLKTRLVSSTMRPLDTDDVAQLYSTNANVDAMNYAKLQELDAATEKTYTADKYVQITCQTADENNELPHNERPPKASEIREMAEQYMDRSVRASKEIALRVGARVVLLANVDVARGLANGTLGHVVRFEGDYPVVQFCGIDGTTMVGPHAWPFDDNGSWAGRFTQIPLALAWAVTIHKSQGATLSKVLTSLRGDNVYWTGAGYVAMSRVRSLQDIWFLDFERGAVFADERVVQWLDTAQ